MKRLYWMAFLLDSLDSCVSVLCPGIHYQSIVWTHRLIQVFFFILLFYHLKNNRRHQNYEITARRGLATPQSLVPL